MAYSKRSSRGGRNSGRQQRGRGNGGRRERGRGTGGRQQRGRGDQDGYAGRGAPSRGGAGGGQGPLIAGLAGGGVIVLVLIVVLLTQGGGEGEIGRSQAARVRENPTPAMNSSPAPARVEPPPPLSDAERDRIRQKVEELALREPEARRLVDAGFVAQREQDYELAQRNWRQARDILQGMIEESEIFFETFSSPPSAENGSDRVELYGGRPYRITGAWPKILASFIKHLD